jgi:hypothetical protein
MKTVDFTGEVAADGRIKVPPEIASQVPAGEPVQIILRWGGSEDDADWRAAGRRRFEAAYSADDSVYEQLIDDAPAR